MSPIKRKKLNKIRNQLDKLDNSLIKIIKKRTTLVKKVLAVKEYKKEIVDKKRINKILKILKINQLRTKLILKLLEEFG